MNSSVFGAQKCSEELPAFTIRCPYCSDSTSRCLTVLITLSTAMAFPALSSWKVINDL